MPLPQLSVHIENQPGRLFQVTDALGSSGINIRGLSLQEGEVSGTLRLITSDIGASRNVLMALDIPGTVEEVVAVSVPDKPGALASVLKPLYEADVNLRYSYSLILGRNAVIIMRLQDNNRGEAVLRNAGIEPIGLKALFDGGTED